MFGALFGVSASPAKGPEPPPSPVTCVKLDRLAAEAGAAFTSALLELARQERLHWQAEQERTEQLRLRLDKEREELAQQRERFEVEKNSFGHLKDDASIVKLDVGGVTNLTVSRKLFTQCEGSMLAAKFNGRWDSTAENDCNYIDFPPALFLPLVDHLRMRMNHVKGQPPVPEPPPFDDLAMEQQFVAMLRHFEILDWVYQQESIKFARSIGNCSYAVLPEISPDCKVARTDMRGVTVTIPHGWYIVDAGDAGFGAAIETLCGCGWGCGMLIAHDAANGCYNGYRTKLSTSGAAGSLFEQPPAWFKTVSRDGREYTFAGSSYRLVICNAPRCCKRKAGASLLERGDETEHCKTEVGIKDVGIDAISTLLLEAKPSEALPSESLAHTDEAAESSKAETLDDDKSSLMLSHLACECNEVAPTNSSEQATVPCTSPGSLMEKPRVVKETDGSSQPARRRPRLLPGFATRHSGTTK